MTLYTGINSNGNKNMMKNELLPPTKDLRLQLGEYIRKHRQLITPESAGFSAAGRRRTPGLRREELAQLCRVSVTWITWLEQGRDVAASIAMLCRLADALQLTDAERSYLFALANRSAPEQANEIALRSLESVLRSVEQMTCPAYVLDQRWDVISANTQAKTLFLHWDVIATDSTPNLLKFLFLSPSAKNLIANWDMRSARLVAEFRADCGRHSDDTLLRQLVAELSAASNVFVQHWQSQEVLEREGGERRFLHPQLGQLVYEQLTLRPALHKQVKIVMLLPMS